MDSNYYVFSLYFYVILIVLQDVATCRYGSAPNCGFSCRCDGSETCDPNTGVCGGSNACGRDVPHPHRYEGAGCRIENLAHGKVATQGRTHRDREANRAVDGIATTADSTCMAVYMPSVTDKAWWMVNLGKIHRILGIYIYNNFVYKDRTNHFDIRVGSTNNIGDQTLCANYVSTRDKDVIQVSCSRTLNGQYVSFRRIGGEEPDRANFCEFVVRGYEIVDCSDCNSGCSKQTGCNLCTAGRKLPDCRHSCPSGYWGVNCNMTCGNCANGQACNKVSGHCSNGCVDWYAFPHCTEYIALPNIASSSLTISDYSDHDISLSWEQYQVPDPVLDEYYFYVIDYKHSTQTDKSTSQEIAQHTTNGLSTNFTLGGLMTQTQYSLHLRVYRRQGDTAEEGIGLGPITFNFHCTAPSRPVLTSDTKKGWYNISFTPMTMLNPGCAFIVSYDLHVICTVIDTRLEIFSFQQDHPYTLDVRTKTTYVIPTLIDMRCKLWLSATNSDNFTISSIITTIDIRKTDTNDHVNGYTSSHLSDIGTTVSDLTQTVSDYGLGPPDGNTSHVSHSDTDNGRISDTTISTALIVGCIVGAAGLLMLVIGVTMVVRNRQHCKKSSEKPDQAKEYENVNINTSDQVYYNIANDGVKVSGPADTVEPTNDICSGVDKQGHYESMDIIKSNKIEVPAIYQTLS